MKEILCWFGCAMTTYCALLFAGDAVAADGQTPVEAITKRFAYVYLHDQDAAEAFRGLLKEKGHVVELVSLDDVPTKDFASFSAVIIGADIKRAWSTSAAKRLAQTGKPVLGLGEGGAMYFEKLHLAIGWMQCWMGGDVGVRVVQDQDSTFWRTDDFNVSDDEAILYSESTHLGCYVPVPKKGVVLLGQELRDSSHYPLVEQNRRNVLWGFDGSPSHMTTLGKQLFVHTCVYVAQADDRVDGQPERSLVIEAKSKNNQEPGSTAELITDLTNRLTALEAQVGELKRSQVVAPTARRSESANRDGRDHRATNPLAGTWVRPDGDQSGIPKIVIAENGGQWTIRAWGDCEPTDCDWGTTTLHLLGDTVSSQSFSHGFAKWDPGFKDSYVVVHLEKDQLVAELYSIYTDDSGRSNTRRISRFNRDQSTAAEEDRASRLSSDTPTRALSLDIE